jgi:adenosylcobyric acid synthase
MFQGTGSDVGKSTLVAALCRAYRRRGLKVRPFKPQNMSNNAAVCPGGGEIGRAQALQARACGVVPTVDMNPVLLKPETDTGAQLVVRGQAAGRAVAGSYRDRRGELLDIVLESYRRVAADADLVLIEGAGSASEVNLRQGDIANMGFAEAAGVPVILVGDIDRGGVIASLVGTKSVVGPKDAARVKGYLINKFRGDLSLFDDGLLAIDQATGWTCFGVVPWMTAARQLPSEDTVVLDAPAALASSDIKIAVPLLSRIANFDDFDPLRLEPGVGLEMVPPGRALPGDARLIVLPGSKSTIGDLAFLRAQGWDVDIAAHLRRGGFVLGICAGMQMLGRRIADLDGVEGPPGEVAGLGYLDIETVMAPEKALRNVAGRDIATGARIAGYEMHVGRTAGAGLARPMLDLGGRTDGAVSADGRVGGCYVHGLFASDEFRAAYLAGLGRRGGSGLAYEATVERLLDDIADGIERAVDLDGLLKLARSA